VLFLIWAMPFDMLMAKLFMSDKPPGQRSRYKTIIVVDLLVWLLLVVIWGQLFAELVMKRL
jgi:hypothetical protein